MLQLFLAKNDRIVSFYIDENVGFNKTRMLVVHYYKCDCRILDNFCIKTDYLYYIDTKNKENYLNYLDLLNQYKFLGLIFHFTEINNIEYDLNNIEVNFKDGIINEWLYGFSANNVDNLQRIYTLQKDIYHIYKLCFDDKKTGKFDIYKLKLTSIFYMLNTKDYLEYYIRGKHLYYVDITNRRSNIYLGVMETSHFKLILQNDIKELSRKLPQYITYKVGNICTELEMTFGSKNVVVNLFAEEAGVSRTAIPTTTKLYRINSLYLTPKFFRRLLETGTLLQLSDDVIEQIRKECASLILLKKPSYINIALVVKKTVFKVVKYYISYKYNDSSDSVIYVSKVIGKGY